MNKFILIFVILAVTFSFTFVEKLTLIGSSKNLGFENYTGRGVTNQMIIALTSFANAASSFYKNDVAANTKYIKKQMDIQYGDDAQNFFVFIQTQQVKYSWFIWMTNQNTIATRTGINKIYKKWSYMFVKILAPPTSQNYAIVTAGTQGDGVSDYADLINDAVNANQSGDQCTCDDGETRNIGQRLINLTGRRWSTVCDSNGVTTALVLGIDGLWAGIKPRKCIYTLYVGQ